jgi:hypothetical protein
MIDNRKDEIAANIEKPKIRLTFNLSSFQVKTTAAADGLHWPSNIHGSECGRNRPGFGWQAVSQKTSCHTRNCPPYNFKHEFKTIIFYNGL